MRTNSAARSSVVGEHRRQQIVRGAITVLSREGMQGTSFTRIAAEAGLSSPGMISYHFADKQALLAAVVADVIGRYDQRVSEATDRAAAPAALAAYIGSAIRFQDEHRDDVRALWQVIWSMSEFGAEPIIDKDSQLSPIKRILDRGVAEGDFRAMDTRWVAKSVHATVTGYLDVFTTDPGVDVEAFTTEVQRLYAHATAASGVAQPSPGPTPERSPAARSSVRKGPSR